jgi:uncharacterized protein
MSDASGPFAVPNFSQHADDEVDDVEDADDVEDGEDTEYSDDDADEFEDETVASEGDDEDRAPVADETPEVIASGPADGGIALSVLEHIARSIVDDPDAVVVDTSAQRGGVRLDLHVASTDMGRIIGRRGRVAQALRSVVRAAAAKDGTDATVDIVD